MEATVLANAKINLYLDVVGKRDDGYHDIESIMQSVSLSDSVNVKLNAESGKSIKQKFIGSDLPCDETNLCYKAAYAYFDYMEIDEYDIEITVTKNIPEAAGLAGGSADAAAVILALDKLYGKNTDTDTLMKIGLKVGSDVAFCIVGGTCVVTGRGEHVTKLARLPEYTVLIVKSTNESVSTKEAYKRIDGKRASVKSHISFADYKKAVESSNKKVIESGVYNIFEEVMQDSLSDTQRIIAKIKENGALAALMSGSGPSVFALFEDASSAEKTAEELKNTVCDCFTCVCKTV